MMNLFLIILLACQGSQAATDFEPIAKEIRSTLEKFVEADTTNPPGNEAKIVKIVAEKFKKAGIEFEITEFAPGRQNIVARLKGSGTEKPVMIIAHTDVVGTANQNWKYPHHKVTEEGGYLYGRGIQDDLGMAAVATEILIYLKKSGVSLRRDIIVALTGDEESDGTGILYILKKNPKSVQAAFALNEGGSLVLDKDGKVHYVALQTAEKIYLDVELIAKGTTGHSSVPLKDNAIYRLGRALDRLSKYQRPARLMEATRAYFAGRAKIESPPLSTAMSEIAKSKGKLPAKALKLLEENPIESANFRTTCIATLVSGGTRVNALPPEAKANINCRILPDETKEQIIADLKKAIDDPTIELKPLENGGDSPPSPLDNEAPIAIKKVAEKFWPNITLVPTVSRGATDSRHLRSAGIPSYGINPVAISEEDGRRAHGVDERTPVASIKRGAEFLHALLIEVAGPK
jgi:acetylornithine deacetylase/succinyl-diaminopimelate desuccinylase-like protein